MAQAAILEGIEVELSRAGRRLRFAPSLELLFEERHSELRRQGMQRFLLSYLVINLLCLFCDHQAGASGFHLGLLFRVYLLAPAVLLALMLLRARSTRVGLLCATTPLVVGTFGVGVLARLSLQPYTDRYLLGGAVAILAQVLLAPIPFSYAALGLVTSLLVFAFLTSMPLSGSFSPLITPDLVFFLAIVAICFLYERFRREQSARKEFLLNEANLLRVDLLTAANAHLERLSSIDSLTGIFNRRYLDAAIQRLWNLSQEHERWIAVVMVDIDHFKAINDTYGHQHGDFCLERVAQVLQQSIRAGIDTVARYGGEEFVAILPDADESTAREIADLIRLRAQEPSFDEPQQCAITVSVGVAALKGTLTKVTLPEFLPAADSALYQAKRTGRNRVVNSSIKHAFGVCVPA